jgi:two-component system, NtrC family, sensor kinase
MQKVCSTTAFDARISGITASTKNLGDRVEITIRDNGPGIPPEVREKMFNPFFTTKPAGGRHRPRPLDYSRQHSGSIEVDTLPGEFTEIRIVLPRTATFIVESPKPSSFLRLIRLRNIARPRSSAP